MRPNLSFETFASVLTALGASALVACAGTEPKPVQANEVAPAAAPAGHVQSSCSAGGCGGSAAAAPATAAAHAPAAAPVVAAAPAPASAPAPVAAPAPAPAAAPAPAVAATPAPATKPAAKAPPPHKAAPKPSNAEASCGAGTCGGDTTKKIL